jgi:aspartate ammonia-lyase
MMTTRRERDLLGCLDVPNKSWYGIQTQIALNNFSITVIYIGHFPVLLTALTKVSRCKKQVDNYIGTVSALVPLLGYAIEKTTVVQALSENKTIRELVLNQKLLSQVILSMVLNPHSMLEVSK